MKLCGHELPQDPRFFPLTQDSVLLAHFAAPKSGMRTLDLGAGQGYLGILMQERTRCVTDGLELLPGAAAAAQENYLRCGTEGEITAGDWRDLPSGMIERYALCVSNPPYFPAAAGPAGRQEAARTAEAGEPDGLCRAAWRALQNGGRFCVCFPPEYLTSWLCALRCARLEPKRLRPVCRRAAEKPSLLLLESKKGAGTGLLWLRPLILETGAGKPAAELNRIYGGAE